jgi:hypothetical protein
MTTTVKLLQRRQNALLIQQEILALGTKRNKPAAPKDGKTITRQKKDNPRVPLTEKDIVRIKKEIAVLQSRI